MRAHTQYSVFAMSIILLIVPLLGCEGDQGPEGKLGLTGPTGPQGETGEAVPFITGVIAAPRHDSGWQEIYGSAELRIVKIPSLPTVRVNDFYMGTRFDEISEGLRYSSDRLPLSPGDIATVRIDYSDTDGDSAQAVATVTVPGDFDVISDPIQAGPADTLRLDWTPSADAEGYYINIATLVRYRDTLGNIHGSAFDLDTIGIDTFFEISADNFFRDGITPGLFQDAPYSYISVSAMTGPLFVDDAGNISGDGHGFIYGCNFGSGVVNFELDVPAKSSDVGKPPDTYIYDRLIDFFNSRRHE